MRIGIDARFYGSLGKGLGRYTQKLIEHLEKIDTENEYWIFLRRENFEEYEPQNPKFHKVLADYAWYSFAEQLGFPWLLHKHKLDLVHFPHFNVPLLYFGKFVITIHDLILLHFPTKRATTLNPLWYWVKFRAYRLAIFAALKRAEQVITISQFTKRDILQHYKLSETKIEVTYEACEVFPQKDDKTQEEVLVKYGIIKPYLLYVGNAYPHKNLERLIDAFGLLKKHFADLSLVLVGKEDYFYQRLKLFAQEKQVADVLFPGFVPDEDLAKIYAGSELYVFPSLYEGFGLPPLEAMAQDVSVLASRAACLPEILGEGAYFADCENEKNLYEAMETMLQDENLRKQLILKGKQQIQKYSWEKMAKETLAIYANTKSKDK